MTLHPDDITLAARVMTDIEPPSGLELRIKKRLDAVTAEAHVRRRPHYWLVPAGVAAALIAVLLVPRFRTAQVPPVLGVPQSISGTVVEPVPVATPAKVPDVPGPLVRVVHLPPMRPAMSEAELAWMARRIPALDPIDTITVDQIVLDTIQPESLLITPLTMTPLVTSPRLGDPDAGRQ